MLNFLQKVSQGMKRLRSIVVVILAVLPMDLGLAWYCRSNCDFWKSVYPPNDHRVRSEEYHHGLAPNRRVIESWGLVRYRYATNSLGFKDAAPRTVDADKEGKMTLFIGDSFTEGKGFDFTSSFVGLIAEKMKMPGIEVLNAAVDSYSPVIYRRKVQHLIETRRLKFDTLVVFLDLSDIHDEVRRYQVDGQGRLVVPWPEREGLAERLGRSLRDNSLLARVFSLAYDQLEFVGKVIKRRIEIAEKWNKSFFDVDGMDLWAYSVTDLDAAAWTYDDVRWAAYGAAGRQRAAGEMDGLLSLLRRRGIELILVVYPWPDQLFHDPEAPRHQGFWRAWSVARGVRFISLFAEFTEGDPRQVLSRYFIANDFHWNAEGHELVARAFLDALGSYPHGSK